MKQPELLGPLAGLDVVMRNVSDSAIVTALHRADETDRPDRLFRDPLARTLIGGKGDLAAAEMHALDDYAWGTVVRTFIFDQLIYERVCAGTDLVVNLAAGLDTRPYRMELPANLSWIETDLPDLIAYKEKVLRVDPRCRLQRSGLDLTDAGSRADLFARAGAAEKQALVVTEGLLIHLDAEQVKRLANDLAAAGFRHWIFDMASPRLLGAMQRIVGARFGDETVPLRFAPAEGPEFVTQTGWRVLTATSTAEAAEKLNRGPSFLQLMKLLPADLQPSGYLCLAERQQ